VFIVFSLLFFTGQQVQAAATEWNFDPIHSNFYFDVNHTYAAVRGFFENFSGTFLFDPDNLQESKMVFKIETKSINTNERKRDNHLRTEEFFDVKNYPGMTFTSKKITKAGGNKYLVDGDLTIKDVTRPITLYLTYFGMKENPLQPKETVAGFESRLTIDRLEYHVGTGKYYKMGVVGKDVVILLTLEMVRKD
jgi:polyisoprenoid-binding protein YceI